jgi:hypothetical protein
VLRRILTYSVCFACVVLAGCTDGIYQHSESSSISPYTKWRISGDLDGMAKAIDNNVETAAVSKSYYPNALVTLDLGKPCMFNRVVLDQGPNNEFGYCRKVGVWTSMDGQTFNYVYAAPGTRRITVLCWVTPVLARYICLRAVVPGDKPWSIGEIYVR